jgi:hypothetical protein
MAKVSPAIYIQEVIEKHFIANWGIFNAYVIEGIENFNLKKVFMASVVSGGSGHNGEHYDNYAEAEKEALNILREKHEKLEREMEEYRNLYKD